ncbi:MAG: hypothetical protein AAF571_08990 [Verrucomicrobiota bacterium]
MIYTLIEKILELLPNCRCAIRLSEQGIERPLKPLERLALVYHKPLCPFCACNQNRFECLERQREKIEAERNLKNS